MNDVFKRNLLRDEIDAEEVLNMQVFRPYLNTDIYRKG